eukprot:scaffold9903_cov30-Tisochrysis_lutea.AAC.7
MQLSASITRTQTQTAPCERRSRGALPRPGGRLPSICLSLLPPSSPPPPPPPPLGRQGHTGALNFGQRLVGSEGEAGLYHHNRLTLSMKAK